MTSDMIRSLAVYGRRTVCSHSLVRSREDIVDVLYRVEIPVKLQVKEEASHVTYSSPGISERDTSSIIHTWYRGTPGRLVRPITTENPRGDRKANRYGGKRRSTDIYPKRNSAPSTTPPETSRTADPTACHRRGCRSEYEAGSDFTAKK